MRPETINEAPAGSDLQRVPILRGTLLRISRHPQAEILHRWGHRPVRQSLP